MLVFSLKDYLRVYPYIIVQPENITWENETCLPSYNASSLKYEMWHVIIDT